MTTSLFEDEYSLSPARKRKAEFFSDFLAVRKQVEDDVEEDWKFKVRSKVRSTIEENRKGLEYSPALKRRSRVEAKFTSE